jgi:hypothetical protein
MTTASALGNEIAGQARWSLRLFGDVQLSERGSGEKTALPGKPSVPMMMRQAPAGSLPLRAEVTTSNGYAHNKR